MANTNSSHVFDATADNFETDVIQASLTTPVLVDFWATWCGPCKTLGPILEKLTESYHGAIKLAKVDVDKEQQLAGLFQIRSVPTVILVKDGQFTDGFAGALPEGQLREFLKKHGIEPALAEQADNHDDAAVNTATLDPHQDVIRLRKLVESEPDQAEHKLDLALALLKTDVTNEVNELLEQLPANLETDDRAVRARAYLDLAHELKNAPEIDVLKHAIASDPNDLQARYLLGTQLIIKHDNEAGLEQLIEMLQRNRDYQEGLPKKALINAFRIIDDQDLVGKYRRKMSSLLLV